MRLLIAWVVVTAIVTAIMIVLHKAHKITSKTLKVVLVVGLISIVVLGTVTLVKSKFTEVSNMFSPTSTTEPKKDSNGFPIENDREWFNK